MLRALRVGLGGDTDYVTGTVNGAPAVWTLAGENLWQAAVPRTGDDRYDIALTAYDKLGRAAVYSRTVFYGDGALSWHHTARDYLNADDLNRIETATAFLRDRLSGLGYRASLLCKTDWQAGDLPPRGEIDRVRGNIDALQWSFYSLPDWREIAYNATVDAGQLNAWEWDLHILGVWLDRMVAGFEFQRAGEIFGGEL